MHFMKLNAAPLHVTNRRRLLFLIIGLQTQIEPS